MRTYSWAIVLAAVLAGGPAGAVDINSLGPVQQKRYCLADMYLAGAIRHDDGQISDQDFNDIRTDIARRVQNKGENYNYSNDFRRLEAAVNTTVDEGPTRPEVFETAEGCRAILR